ncbi:Metallo-dependent phosphatase [Chlorella sorokiniana]|uniref:Purple acid phosphatase n=1 Tax=Chlorella sorokiniana TaxID=3076 RepID=A0A2P6TMK9_CHLSO|nr:Metallo-dependent phosphatase [Chlorella sorokiniana]|eukprot:PRW45579.1 Metallo-dependent phosphatase [Chlorella sorokiniana]
MGRLTALAIAAALTAAALLTRLSGDGGACHVRRPGQAHNPLELWRTDNVHVEAAPGGNGPANSPANGPRITCNVTSLAGQHAWVEVVWSGVPGGRYDDYIALFAADASPLASAPMKWGWAARSPSHIKLGVGSLEFRLLNMRQDLRFALVRNGLQFPTVVAWSEVVRVEQPNEPMQGHLSLTGVPGEVRVQWVTRDRGQPAVRWGTASGSLQHSAAGDSLTYSRAEMCGPPANDSGWMEPGWLHGAVMSGLQPATRYFYQYGDEELGWSAEESFMSPPAVGPNTAVRLLAVADLGQAEVDGSMEASEMLPSLHTTARLAHEVAAGAQLLVHNGDISYARGFSSQWDVYFDQLGPTVRRVPYMTTVGNHERDWPGSGDRFPAQYDSGGECGIPYYRRTRMPTAAEDKHWFSFDFGPIHFIQYSTEHLFERGSEQRAWIEADLKAVNRSRTPWVVVGGHRPIYIDSKWFGQAPDGDQYVAKLLRESFEELFHRYQVDATWHGHHHSYQRTCPLFRGRCQAAEADGSAGGTVHLVIGHAGAGLTPNVRFFRPRIFEAVHLKHGYMRVEANGTHMVHQVLSSYDGALLDEFTLTKPLGWRFQPRPASLGSAESSSRGSGGSTHSSSSLMSGPRGRLFGRMWTNGAPAAVA